jgi:hypothetical protein
MSYDLFFCVPSGVAAPTPDELGAYFASRPGYEVQGLGMQSPGGGEP